MTDYYEIVRKFVLMRLDSDTVREIRFVIRAESEVVPAIAGVAREAKNERY
jgi:hypothetical protein